MKKMPMMIEKWLLIVVRKHKLIHVSSDLLFVSQVLLVLPTLLFAEELFWQQLVLSGPATPIPNSTGNGILT